MISWIYLYKGIHRPSQNSPVGTSIAQVGHMGTNDENILLEKKIFKDIVWSGIVKRTAAMISLILLLVIFPFLGSGAFADFLDKGSFTMESLFDPVNLFLLGIGLTFVGSRA
jgi:hypothetical protein